MCLEPNAETKGLSCRKYKVCSPCIDSAIEARMHLLGRDKK